MAIPIVPIILWQHCLIQVYFFIHGVIKYTFYGELEILFDLLPKYNTKMALRVFNAKVGRGQIFGPTIGKLSFSNNNCIRLITFAVSENIIVKNIYFEYRHTQMHIGISRSIDTQPDRTHISSGC